MKSKDPTTLKEMLYGYMYIKNKSGPGIQLNITFPKEWKTNTLLDVMLHDLIRKTATEKDSLKRLGSHFAKYKKKHLRHTTLHNSAGISDVPKKVRDNVDIAKLFMALKREYNRCIKLATAYQLYLEYTDVYILDNSAEMLNNDDCDPNYLYKYITGVRNELEIGKKVCNKCCHNNYEKQMDLSMHDLIDTWETAYSTCTHLFIKYTSTSDNIRDMIVKLTNYNRVHNFGFLLNFLVEGVGMFLSSPEYGELISDIYNYLIINDDITGMKSLLLSTYKVEELSIGIIDDFVNSNRTGDIDYANTIDALFQVLDLLKKEYTHLDYKNVKKLKKELAIRHLRTVIAYGWFFDFLTESKEFWDAPHAINNAIFSLGARWGLSFALKKELDDEKDDDYNLGDLVFGAWCSRHIRKGRYSERHGLLKAAAEKVDRLCVDGDPRPIDKIANEVFWEFDKVMDKMREEQEAKHPEGHDKERYAPLDFDYFMKMFIKPIARKHGKPLPEDDKKRKERRKKQSLLSEIMKTSD